jgi:hypothetical protein
MALQRILAGRVFLGTAARAESGPPLGVLNANNRKKGVPALWVEAPN